MLWLRAQSSSVNTLILYCFQWRYTGSYCLLSKTFFSHEDIFKLQMTLSFKEIFLFCFLTNILLHFVPNLDTGRLQQGNMYPKFSN